MKTEKTQRGFQIGAFTDAYGVECTAQISSIMADDEHIWLGAKNIGLKRFEPHIGWSDVETPSAPYGVSYVANNRMHLSQSQAGQLAEVLMYFAEHGELPSSEGEADAQPPR